MVAVVLMGLGAALALLTVGLRRPDSRARLVPTGLVLALVAGGALATALGSHVSGRPHALLVIVGLVAAAVGGNHVTTAVFQLVDSAHDDELHAAADPTVASDSLSSAAQVLRGGAWIGTLERLAVFATLTGRWPEGIAVVLAVKGLGRYPELRSGHRPGLAERFIIGTLVSVLWAGLCAYAATGPALG
jgi:hypothetical protein